jgi:hypothetical protein
MSWRLRLEYVRYAAPGFAAGGETRLASVLAVQTLSGAGATVVTADPAPDFGQSGGAQAAGCARVTALSGAALVAWGDAPVPSESSAVRLEPGRTETVSIAPGQRIAACEATDSPAGRTTYALLANAAATGATVSPIASGAYVFSAAGTFGGATVKLQALGPDGATWSDVASLAAAGSTGVVLGEGASVRAAVAGGSPAGLYATLS